MRNTVVFVCMLNLVACSETQNDYYSGVIVDDFGRPVESALVTEFIADSSYARQLTDSNGYFEFKRSEGILPDMILSKEGFTTDTIPLVWSMGERLEYSSMILKDSSKYTLQRVK